MTLIKNMGSFDRLVRTALGLALVVLAATGVFAPWGWIGVVPLATAMISYCPLYAIFGLKGSKAS
ncbi:MAG: hypothetical protein ACI9ZH_000901 [Paracoccaceae bacterium]|jgi:hypothetical protein